MRLFLLLIMLFPAAALAEIRIAATTSNMGMLASEVGGQRVRVSVLAPPDRDPHYLQARPSMIAALRRSHFVIAVGAGLEEGWLPAAIPASANPNILPGRPAYFEASDFTQLKDTGLQADRAMGDAHPEGNPHFYLHPEKMSEVARALAIRLSELWPEYREEFEKNALNFQDRLNSRAAKWKTGTELVKGAVLFHKDADYLMDYLGVKVYGYLEPLPGIPPTGRHLSRLIQENKGRAGVILYLRYQPERGPNFLAHELDWEAKKLNSNIPVGGSVEDYIELIDSWVTALAQQNCSSTRLLTCTLPQ
jgi:zinc/manganese transport system substrate-binding protein